jgi:hypothetical protein
MNKLNDLQKEKIEANVVLGEHQAKLRTIEVKHQELLQANHKQDLRMNDKESALDLTSRKLKL